MIYALSHHPNLGVQSHWAPCCPDAVAPLTYSCSETTPPPQLVSVCESASPICLKHSVYRCIPWSSTACLIHFSLTHFQLSQTPTAWCHFNLIYPLPPPHLLHTSSRVTYCSYMVQKNTQVLSPLGPFPPSRILFLPSHSVYLENKCSLFFKICFTVAFFLKPFSGPHYYLFYFSQHLYLFSITALYYLFCLTILCDSGLCNPLNSVKSTLGPSSNLDSHLLVHQVSVHNLSN